MDEVWKPVLGYEGVYEVSDQGRVKRIKSAKGARVGRILKPGKHHGGYVHVVLSRECATRPRLVHLIVLEAFVGPVPPGMESNHKNGVRDYNWLENLEYVSHQENVDHSRQVLGFDNAGSRHVMARFVEADIVEMRRLYSAGVGPKMIGDRFDCSGSVVSKIVARRGWTHV